MGAWLALLLLLGLTGITEGDATALVRGIERRYEKARTLKAAFLEIYREGKRDVRAESGTVYFSRPGRMRWEYEAPEEKLFLVDGRQVWFYVPADRTVTRTKVNESSDWQTPFAMLAGKIRLSRFCGRMEPVEAIAASALRCLPKARDAPFQEVLLEVDSAYQLARVIVREAGGVETEFRFADWAENPPLPEHLFHFAPPPGVAIVEAAMR